MKIILLGAPGAGKGTQARLIVSKYNIAHISTGDMLREEIRSNSKLGETAKTYISQGKLVPDEIIFDIVKKRLQNDDCKNGFVLDGFPRTLKQAEKLEEITSIDYVIDLSVNKDALIKRLTSRLTCKDCASAFSTKDNLTACPLCGGTLYQREDDTEDVIKNRFNTYEKQTNPLKDFYKSKNKLHSICSDGSVESIFKDIQKVLNN